MSLPLALFAAIGLRSGKEPIATDGLVEASANFDAHLVKPFLTQLAGQFETGFTAQSAAVLARRITSLWLGQSGNWAYDLQFSGQAGRLVVCGFKDDFSAPDLYLFSSPAIAPVVQQELTSFLAAAGI